MEFMAGERGRVNADLVAEGDECGISGWGGGRANADLVAGGGVTKCGTSGWGEGESECRFSGWGG